MAGKLVELAKNAGILLKKHKIMLVTAESCTGGLIATAMTAIPGSSAWFDRGFVTYTNAAKSDMLAVSATLIEQAGAVSEAVVLAMARGAINASQAHLSVAVSGIAGPEGAAPGKPVGTVWIAWGQKLGYAEAAEFGFTGSRSQIREASACAALEGVIDRLKE